MRRFWMFAVAATIVLAAGAAWAGGGGNPPGGGDGGGGAEPELVALILFSLIPGFLFTRRLVAARRESESS